METVKLRDEFIIREQLINLLDEVYIKFKNKKAPKVILQKKDEEKKDEAPAAKA